VYPRHEFSIQIQSFAAGLQQSPLTFLVILNFMDWKMETILVVCSPHSAVWKQIETPM